MHKTDTSSNADNTGKNVETGQDVDKTGTCKNADTTENRLNAITLTLICCKLEVREVAFLDLLSLFQSEIKRTKLK